MPITYRPAQLTDIPGMHRVRLAVRENRLSNPLLVTEADYDEMLRERGAGWVAENDGEVVGFAILDAREQNVWALFVNPAAERQGIGRRLFGLLTEWAAEKSLPSLWLSTEPGTRADGFYEAAGWRRAGFTPSGEARFEWRPAR